MVITALVAGLTDMIESGRLTKADIPDDFEWLCAAIEKAKTGSPKPKTPAGHPGGTCRPGPDHEEDTPICETSS